MTPEISFAPKDPVEIQIEENLKVYIEKLKDTGVIQGLLVGHKEGLKMSFIWNIYSRDYTFDETGGREFDNVGNAIFEFKKSLKEHMPLRINEVLPSKLEELHSSCREEGLITSTFYFNEDDSLG